MTGTETTPVCGNCGRDAGVSICHKDTGRLIDYACVDCAGLAIKDIKNAVEYPINA